MARRLHRTRPLGLRHRDRASSRRDKRGPKPSRLANGGLSASLHPSRLPVPAPVRTIELGVVFTKEGNNTRPVNTRREREREHLPLQFAYLASEAKKTAAKRAGQETGCELLVGHHASIRGVEVSRFVLHRPRGRGGGEVCNTAPQRALHRF